MKPLLFALALTALGFVHAQDHYISGGSQLGCADAEYYEQLVSYAVQGDMEAFEQALTQAAYAGVCIAFESGESVYLEDTKIWSGLTKVRRPGDTVGYWTQIEAVKSR